MAYSTDGSSALQNNESIDLEKSAASEGKVINLDDYRNQVERKIAQTSEEITKNLQGNSDLTNELKSKIRSIINQEEIKTSSEEINELAETISQKLGIDNNTEIKIEAKKIRIEVQKWKEENLKAVEEFRKEEIEKKFTEETKKLNPDLKAEELNQVKEYGKLIAETYAKDSLIEDQKDQALENNQSYGPGKLENAWMDLNGVTNFLTKTPNEIKDIKGKYDSLRSGLRNVNLPGNLKEGRSFENVISIFSNQTTNQLFSRTQNYLGWADRIDKLTGGWLSQTVMQAGQKVISRIGNQAISEFATNALGVIAQQGFQQGFSTIMNGVLSGGVSAATTTAAGAAATGTAAAGGAAATGAAVAGGAAVSATGVGAIVVAAAAVAKVVKDVVGKIATSLGVNFKKELQENFGKVGGAIISGGIFIVGLPALLIGMVSMAVVGPILLLVFGGLMGYQLLMGNSISSLVPPKGTDTSIVTEDQYTSPGDVVLPPVDPNQKVTGQMVVDMASSLIGKTCYYYGGGHGHFYPEPVNGVDPNWNKRNYTVNGVTRSFGNDTQFGSDTTRYSYGPDCSGFVNWVYHQLGINTNGAVSDIYSNARIKNISSSELQLGDIGVKSDMGHIGIFAGRDAAGNLEWIHDGSTGFINVCGGQPGFVKEGVNPSFVKFARIL